MHELEYTPSIYLLDTDNKTNLSEEMIFQLSCTNHKRHIIIPNISPTNVHLEQQLHHPSQSNLKTQEFFDEFDNNFVITFDDEKQEEPLASTAVFYSEKEHSNNSPHKEDEQPINLSLPDKKSVSSCFRQANSLLSSAEGQKDKNSPIPAFEVKKRTVFKNKQNIISNAQNFKITKKKLINQNTFQLFAGKTRSCKVSKKQTLNHQSLTSKVSSKEVNLNFLIETQCRSNIFLEHRKARESFHSTTLDQWRRRFNYKKKSLELRGQKQENIFEKPFSLK